jgi:hypothetical protein
MAFEDFLYDKRDGITGSDWLVIPAQNGHDEPVIELLPWPTSGGQSTQSQDSGVNDEPAGMLTP